MRFARTWLTRASLVVASLLAASALGGCNKPSEDDCRKALGNIRNLLGTQNLSQADESIEGEVRRCRGGSKRESVQCAIDAKTLDELRKCKLVEVPADAATAPADAATAPVAPPADAAAPTAPVAPAADAAAPTAPVAPAAAPTAPTPAAPSGAAPSAAPATGDAAPAAAPAAAPTAPAAPAK